MIRAQNLSFSHRNMRILDQIDLHVDRGQMLVIIGPNGAGKSTLLNLLANEKASPKDEIYFKGKHFADWDAQTLAHHKAKFSQEHNNDIGLQVKDIVLMGRYPYFKTTPAPEDIATIEAMMKKTEVFQMRNRNYNSLSGGEKQRVHLARVFAQLQNDISAKLAFFDEPLNNLDVRHQFRILENIKEFTTKGNSALIVLHDLNLAAEFADNILLLKEGQIVAYGKPQHIFTTNIISKAYDFPCAICENPITQNPMIVFRDHIKQRTTDEAMAM